MRISFVGLGAMGVPMAGALVNSGFQITVFDVVAQRVQSLVDLGASASGSPREAVENTDVLVLMVANADQAEEALFGVDGAAASMKPGTSLAVTSTIGPEAIRRIAGRLQEYEVGVLDVPVSGGTARAERGDLLIMAGGERSLFDNLSELLEVMGSSVVYCGESVGDGQSVKLVNQLLCGVHIAAAGEALAYASSLGLDPRFVFETIKHGAANSFMLEDRGERMLDGEFTPAKSALDIFVKDLDLVLDAAGPKSSRLPISSAARQTFREGASVGLGAEDDSGVVRVFGYDSTSLESGV
jgi:3-hydroxyisobutyrate dehydrogenase-like beta-hydroxyacid dehydrogenase